MWSDSTSSSNEILITGKPIVRESASLSVRYYVSFLLQCRCRSHSLSGGRYGHYQPPKRGPTHLSWNANQLSISMTWSSLIYFLFSSERYSPCPVGRDHTQNRTGSGRSSFAMQFLWQSIVMASTRWCTGDAHAALDSRHSGQQALIDTAIPHPARSVTRRRKMCSPLAFPEARRHI